MTQQSSTSSPPFVVKLVAPSVWPDICRTGVVPFSALDETDGFMHLSTQDQMIETANRYYTAHERVLGLKIETAAIEAPLKWEPAAKRNNDLFPHLYGPCPKEAIAALMILTRDNEGVFSIMTTLQTPVDPDTDFMAL